MRGIAAVFVFGFHATYYLQFSSQDFHSGWNTFFRQGGYAAVGYFFVLSGFVLTWSHRPGDTARTFWRRRAFKIWPNHLITFAAAAMLLTWVSGFPQKFWHGVVNVLLIQSWWPQIEVRASYNGPAWSLAAEVLFYICFPVVLVLINKIRPERLWAWAGGVFAGIFGIAAVGSWIIPGGTYFALSRNWFGELFWIYQFPASRMLDFVLGILLARIFITKRRIPFTMKGALALTVVAYVIGSFGPITAGGFTYAAVMIIPIAFIILAAAKRDLDGKKSWVASRFMVWTGDVSFAFYMWHVLTLTYGYLWLFDQTPKGTLPVVAEFLVLYLLTMALSGLTFAFYERPIMNRFGRRRAPIQLRPDISPHRIDPQQGDQRAA
jgi:peptidoglycan/LPS O-acetylase OafA/YrhL